MLKTTDRYKIGLLEFIEKRKKKSVLLVQLRNRFFFHSLPVEKAIIEIFVKFFCRLGIYDEIEFITKVEKSDKSRVLLRRQLMKCQLFAIKSQ